MRPAIAQCSVCKTATVQNNGPNGEIPTPIYGPRGLAAHRDHGIQYFGARADFRGRDATRPAEHVKNGAGWKGPIKPL